MNKNLNLEKSTLEQDFNVFLQSELPLPNAAMATELLPDGVLHEPLLKKLKAKVGRDLVKSPFQLGFIYTGLSLVGYAVSLIVCAQWSFGLSQFSHFASFHLHNLQGPVCPLLCGAVFTGIPFLLSCLFLNRFQQRYLITRMWWFLALVPIAATALMLVLPKNLQHSHASSSVGSGLSDSSGALWIGLWTLSAILTPYLLEALVYLIIKPKKYKGQLFATNAGILKSK